MLVYLLIFAAIVLVIALWGFIDFIREETKDVGACWFFGILAALSGTAVGFAISLLSNS